MVKPLVPPAIDILGPFLTTPQSVSLRPGKVGDPAGSGYSWWKDCTDDNSEDGTPITAEALNNFKAQLLTLFLAAGASINDTDEMITHAVRSQRLNFIAAPGGTANALTITLDPVAANLAALLGTPLRIKIAANNTGAATLAVNGLAATPIVRFGALPLRANDLQAGVIAEVKYDGTSFQLLSVAAGVPTIVDFVTPGTFNWTCPAGVFFVTAEVWGGGGGGAGSVAAPPSNAVDFAGEGGAGGGYARKVCPVVPGTVYVVTVGAAGTAGPGANNGGPGGTSSFSSFCSATGGAAGRVASATTGSPSTLGRVGGAGAGGDVNLSGGWGNVVVATPTSALPGAGGAAPLGGLGAISSTTTPSAAGSPGGGGGGSGGTGVSAGSAGGPGRVTLTYN